MNVIDTNVWIYCHDTRFGDKQAKAQEVVLNTPDIILPWQVGCEFLAAARKLSSFGFTEEQAWLSLEAMREIAIAVTMPDVSHWEIAQRLSRNHLLSFWDSMLLAACVASGAKTLITEDLNDGQMFEGVQIVNPFKSDLQG